LTFLPVDNTWRKAKPVELNLGGEDFCIEGDVVDGGAWATEPTETRQAVVNARQAVETLSFIKEHPHYYRCLIGERSAWPFFP
jgi:hypothetical protein